MAERDLDGLYDDLVEEFGNKARTGGRSHREERIIAGFEEIQRFVDEHGQAPRHGEGRDIFERIYAVRLDRMRALEECRAILTPTDRQGLLAEAPAADPANLDDDALLAELEGLEGLDDGAPDLGELRHVRSAEQKRAAEEIASRRPCRDFIVFKPLFEAVQQDLDTGRLATKPFELKSEIVPSGFYILDGQKAYIAEMEEPYVNENGYTEARLRVVFDNGTESNLLMRSLQKALRLDPAGRIIVSTGAGPLFGSEPEAGDAATGTVYVLRSKSSNPFVVEHREVLHKIGVTSGSVERRITNARQQPTFLMADVEVVATYKLYNIKQTRLEGLIHRIFRAAQLDVAIQDRFGHPVEPEEWFLVPLSAIEEAIERIIDGSITGYVYDPASASLVQAA